MLSQRLFASILVEVPELDDVIAAADKEEVFPRRPGEAGGVFNRKKILLLFFLEVPDFDAVVVGEKCEALTARAPGEVQQSMRRDFDHVNGRPGVWVPKLDGVVEGGGHQKLSVAALAQRGNGLLMCLDDMCGFHMLRALDGRRGRSFLGWGGRL